MAAVPTVVLRSPLQHWTGALYEPSPSSRGRRYFPEPRPSAWPFSADRSSLEQHFLRAYKDGNTGFGPQAGPSITGDGARSSSSTGHGASGACSSTNRGCPRRPPPLWPRRVHGPLNQGSGEGRHTGAHASGDASAHGARRRWALPTASSRGGVWRGTLRRKATPVAALGVAPSGDPRRQRRRRRRGARGAAAAPPRGGRRRFLREAPLPFHLIGPSKAGQRMGHFLGCSQAAPAGRPRRAEPSRHPSHAFLGKSPQICIHLHVLLHVYI